MSFVVVAGGCVRLSVTGMTRYRIHPGGVETVLRATASEAGELGPILAPLPESVDCAALCAGSSAPIVAALTELLTAEQTRTTAMGLRIEACLTGADRATRHYVRGDDEMARTTQANAVAAADRLAR